jgi:hypothetical protein
MKTNQTISLTVCVCEFWKTRVLGEGIKDVSDKTLLWWNRSGKIKYAL